VQRKSRHCRWVGFVLALRHGSLLALFERAEPRCELRLVGEEPPGVDEAQAAALQLRALFSDLRRFENILKRKWNAWVDGMRGRKNTSRRRGRTHLGLDVSHRVMLANMQHQVLDAVCEAHHQLAWWQGSTTIEYTLRYRICALLAFGFLAERLHHRPSPQSVRSAGLRLT